MTITPLLNVGELIEDPDFCQSFKVLRRKGTWNLGRFTTTETEINTYGIIDPQATNQMQFNPDGVLIKGLIKVYTHTELYTTHKRVVESNNNSGATVYTEENYNSDILIWDNHRYLILDEENYKDYGYRGYTCQIEDASGAN